MNFNHRTSIFTLRLNHVFRPNVTKHRVHVGPAQVAVFSVVFSRSPSALRSDYKSDASAGGCWALVSVGREQTPKWRCFTAIDLI